MGQIRHQRTESVHDLEQRTLVGRREGCTIELDDRSVSREHTRIRWNGSSWLMRDLGSRNGTFVDGHRLEPGVDVELFPGMTLAFGDKAEPWVVVDLSPPGDAKKIDPLVDTAVFEYSAMRLEDLTLVFRVSRDEEYVEMRLDSNGQSVAAPVRSHQYLLLTLARARLGELPDATHEGWVERDRLCKLLAMDTNRLNVEVHRARAQLEELGVEGADGIVERSRRLRALRLGIERVLVEQL